MLEKTPYGGVNTQDTKMRYLDSKILYRKNKTMPF